MFCAVGACQPTVMLPPVQPPLTLTQPLAGGHPVVLLASQRPQLPLSTPSITKYHFWDVHAKYALATHEPDPDQEQPVLVMLIASFMFVQGSLPPQRPVIPEIVTVRLLLHPLQSLGQATGAGVGQLQGDSQSQSFAS